MHILRFQIESSYDDGKYEQVIIDIGDPRDLGNGLFGCSLSMTDVPPRDIYGDTPHGAAQAALAFVASYYETMAKRGTAVCRPA